MHEKDVSYTLPHQRPHMVAGWRMCYTMYLLHDLYSVTLVINNNKIDCIILITSLINDYSIMNYIYNWDGKL